MVRLDLESVVSAVGLVLSAYALYVEYKNEHKAPDEEFTSLCDIEAIGASCSAVFALPEGRMVSYLGIVPEESPLDLPNAALGIIFYTYRIFLADLFPSYVTQIATVLGFLSSVFLAYKLTFVLGDLCVLCMSIHVINTVLMYRLVVSFTNKQTKTKKL
ncbi:hypothetical protein ACA910_008518 [Epithemia clementina (nom. ined.)]